MLVTPQTTNYNYSVGVACFTLVCVEEDIDTSICTKVVITGIDNNHVKAS